MIMEGKLVQKFLCLCKCLFAYIIYIKKKKKPYYQIQNHPIRQEKTKLQFSQIFQTQSPIQLILGQAV